MRNPFRTRSTAATNPIVGDPVAAEAYREGRLDENRRVRRDPVMTRETVVTRTDKAAIDEAYRRGRATERRARRGSPLMTLLVLLVVFIGGLLIYLAIQNGSFSNGGAVVDHSIDTAEHKIDAPLKNAAETTGEALQKAGQKLK